MSVRDLFDRRLGFGCMRLPTIGENEVDFPQFERMIDTYLERGFRYFDTAYMYIGGNSETAVRECLVKRHDRSEFYLATKMPLMHLKEEADCERIFNEQLEKTGVEYFDLYLMHNVNHNTYPIAQKCKAFEFGQKMLKEGKIKHLGFSFHDTPEYLEMVLSEHPEVEFVQIQLNYFDWESDNVQSRKCYEVLQSHDLPIIVMEPVKGGSLVNIPEEGKKKLAELNPERSVASYAVRFAASQPQVMVVLSGMSTYEQLDDNTRTMQNFVPLRKKEVDTLFEIADIIRAIPQIPCTDCRYCMEKCPQGIPIPNIFRFLNSEAQFKSANPQQGLKRAVRDGAMPSSCIECWSCAEACPQHLEIPELLKQARQYEE